MMVLQPYSLLTRATTEMYDIDFSGLLWFGVVLGVLLTLAAWGLWELADWLIDVQVSLAS